MHWSTTAAACLPLAALALPVAAAFPDARSAAQAYGAREAIQQISISPDGSKIAIVAPMKGRGAALLIADPEKDAAPHPIMFSDGDPERLTDCHWSTDTRLVCNIYMIADVSGRTLTYTRMMAIDSDGKNMKELSARTNTRSLGIMQNGGDVIDWLAEGKGGAVLMTRQFVPEQTIGTMLASSQQGLGVERVDTITLVRNRVEQPRREAAEFISDGHGTVRIMGIQPASDSGYVKDRIEYFYRRPGARAWDKLGTLRIGGGADTGFNPYAVDRDLNVAYGFDRTGDRRALYKVALDGSLARDLVLERPDVDVSGLIQVGRQNRVVGATFVTDKQEAEFFDPELRQLRVSLGKALPKHPLVTFVDASADESKLLLFAGSDVDPGRYYLFDKKMRHMAEIMPVRPELERQALATVKAITFPAADGTPIPAYLTLPPGSDGKNLPAIVMPHGGPSSRDEWGFDWLSQFFAARGFAVLQPNYRGSSGYGAAWFQKNGFQSWRTAIGDVNDAGRWLAKQGIAAPGKLAIVGWSYGGYAALQSAVLDPDLFKAIVAVAPVTDLETLRGESRFLTNFGLVDRFIGTGPHVAQGSPARNVQAIKAPVLLFHGDLDRNVGVAESRMMASRLKSAGRKVDYVEFHGLDHQLEDASARAAMLERADTFLHDALRL